MVSHITPRNGYYTATEAAILLGMGRMAFSNFVNDANGTEDADARELRDRRVKNTSDRRSWLYPSDVIDRLRAHAVPSERLRLTDVRQHPRYAEIMTWLDNHPLATKRALRDTFEITDTMVDRMRNHWLDQREENART